MKLEHRFFINISREKYLHYYAGHTSSVQVVSEQGITIQFPASALKPWVTHQGINGYYKIIFDSNNKLVELGPVNL